MLKAFVPMQKLLNDLSRRNDNTEAIAKLKTQMEEEIQLLKDNKLNRDELTDILSHYVTTDSLQKQTESIIESKQESVESIISKRQNTAEPVEAQVKTEVRDDPRVDTLIEDLAELREVVQEMGMGFDKFKEYSNDEFADLHKQMKFKANVTDLELLKQMLL